MKKSLFTIFLLLPLFGFSQTVIKQVINGQEVETYRLDETQINKIKSYQSTALSSLYKRIERELNLLLKSPSDKMALDNIAGYLSAIAQYDNAPNLLEMANEYNIYMVLNHKPKYSLPEKHRYFSDSVTDSLDYQLTTDTSIKFPHHNYGAKFIGNNFNRIVDRLEGYITDKMKYSRIGDMRNDKEGNIINSFQNNGINRNIRNLNVKYYLKAPFGSDMRITKIEISGDWEPVVYLFCYYWPTSINFDDKTKGATATTRFSTDYIKIISDYPKAKLEITTFE